jgi:hypothetical protein
LEKNLFELTRVEPITQKARAYAKESYLQANKFYNFGQGTLTEGEGSVQLTSLYLTSLCQLLLIMQTLFSFLQNKLL